MVAVTGGDGTFDETATLQYEAAAPAEDADRQKVSRDVMREIARLHLRAPVGTPLHVRTPAPMVDTLAGLDGALTYGAIRRSWVTVRAHGEAWLSAATPHAGLPWADRATTLAAMCTEKKRWGDTGPSHAHLPLAAAPDPDTCCICFEDFADMLPAPEINAHSRHPTAPGAFTCSHVLCRACDRTLQASANPRCPMCRQPRAHWISLRP